MCSSDLSYVHKLSDRWRLGMSLLSFAGAGLDPSNDWAGRNEMTKVELFTLSFAPMAAFRVTDWLSVGGGPLISYGRLDMTVRLPSQVPPGTEPNLKLDDLDDWAVTGMASVLIEPCADLRFGVVYQGEGASVRVEPKPSGAALELTDHLMQFVISESGDRGGR